MPSATRTHGTIHRDIKPENILLQGGHALVADFGIALALQTASGERLTRTGMALGTPQYMSAEQALGERTLDARSDIYALAAVTYAMLAGTPPSVAGPLESMVARREITELRDGVGRDRRTSRDRGRQWRSTRTVRPTRTRRPVGGSERVE